MPSLILAAVNPDNTPHGYNLTFAFPMLLFIIIGGILYLLFSRPHRRVPARTLTQPARSSAVAGPEGHGAHLTASADAAAPALSGESAGAASAGAASAGAASAGAASAGAGSAGAASAGAASAGAASAGAGSAGAGSAGAAEADGGGTAPDDSAADSAKDAE